MSRGLINCGRLRFCPSKPSMILGLVEESFRQAVGGDVVGLNAPGTLLSYLNKNWKPGRFRRGWKY